MAGMAGMAQGNMRQALSGMARASDLQEKRELTGMQMKRAYRQQQIGGTLSGAAAGATIGASIGAAAGGIGAVPGAIIGGFIGLAGGYGASSYA